MSERNEKTSTKKKGDKGETLAQTYLEERGFEVLCKNWRYERYELDIVATKADVIVFVEVKTRYSDTYGEPWEAVNKGKRKRICLAADAFIQQFKIEKEPRFDIISILKLGEQVQIQHIEEAFWPMA